jgi:hypothetical protein
MISGLEAAVAQDSRYRVEILVLTHLDHHQEAQKVVRLEDFTSALDFLQPPAEEESETGTEPPTEDGEAVPPEDLSSDLADEEPENVDAEDALNAVTPVTEMGPEMQDAWRRLRLSAPFRPLQYLAWEQGSNPPFPVLRVHDPEAVLVEDPWAELRLEEALPDGVESGSGAVFGDAAATAEDPAAETELPDPIVYYRLDGTASLTRSRFLHLRLAVEWREPLFDPSDDTVRTGPASPASVAGGPMAVAESSPSAFQVHRLEQSRPVRTGRMEYFDGPVLGVLAWISDITDTLATEPAE